MLAKSPAIRIESKSARGRFAGTAWAFAATPDRAGDLILPSALTQAIAKHKASGTGPEIRVEHEPTLVAGVIDVMNVNPEGLQVEGQLDLKSAAGKIAFDRLSSGEADGLSIGFSGTAETSGRSQIFTAIDLVEISVVRYPMNAGARISAVKSWRDAQSAIDLERVFRDVLGMPNRLAQKTALAAWPVLHSQEATDAGVRAALAKIINAGK